jgi:hypothetical protein
MWDIVETHKNPRITGYRHKWINCGYRQKQNNQQMLDIVTLSIAREI